jgi:hypothetical protein
MKGEPVPLDLPPRDDPPGRSHPPVRPRPAARDSEPTPWVRTGPDWCVRAVPKIAFVAWCLLGVAAGCLAAAQPPARLGFFARWTGTTPRSEWDAPYLVAALALALGAGFLSVLGLALHARRLRRRTDRVHWPLVSGSLVASLATLLCAWLLTR